MRTAIGAGIGLWLLEVTAGTIGFIWPNLTGGFGGAGRDRHARDRQGAELDPARSTRASRPTTRRPAPSSSSSTRASSSSCRARTRRGDGTALNVRALYQRCPHLGCKPNPCLKNFWFECPCHGSRYDRLGIKADGAAVRPGAARHGPLLDHRRLRRACLTINTGKITLGPLPVALGQPGLIPPRTPTGCI